LRSRISSDSATRSPDVSPSKRRGVEVEYLYTSKLLDETKPERALAVTTPNRPVVLHL
jgi:hypothetical protein